MLGAWFLVLGPCVLGAKYLVPGALCLVLGVWFFDRCLALDAWVLVLGAWCLVLRAWCSFPGVWCLAIGA